MKIEDRLINYQVYKNTKLKNMIKKSIPSFKPNCIKVEKRLLNDLRSKTPRCFSGKKSRRLSSIRNNNKEKSS